MLHTPRPRDDLVLFKQAELFQALLVVGFRRGRRLVRGFICHIRFDRDVPRLHPCNGRSHGANRLLHAFDRLGDRFTRDAFLEDNRAGNQEHAGATACHRLDFLENPVAPECRHGGRTGVVFARLREQKLGRNKDAREHAVGGF